MKTSTVIRDKISGTPFAVLVNTNGGFRAFGASGQGSAWAEWAQRQSSLDSAISSLDVTLVHEQDVPLTTEFLDSIAKDFDQQTLGDMRHIASQKALLVFANTKSDPEPEKTDYEEMNEFSEAEDVNYWPITDAALATIDVAYKQLAINYKAKAFKLDTKRAGILLQVKGARAIWDPNMPGGGGWRCPDNTMNGGQFTNRLGRGCTMGLMRRIGRSLIASSLKDMAKAVDDAANVDLPNVNRAGRALTSAADARDVRLQNKFKNRAERRARKLAEVKAKEQLKQGAITWRQAYESLDKDKTRRGRARIATALVAKRMADDAATRAFNAETRRERRRAGRIVEKTPPPSAVATATTPDISGQQAGPSRREIIAERLRQTAQNIVGEDGTQTRRMARRARRGAATEAQESTPDSRYSPPGAPARQVRGQTPEPGEIATRFARGENQSRMNEIRAIRRELRGEQPRSTTPFRERIARRQRRRAARIAGEIPDDQDYAEYESSRVDLPQLAEGPLDKNAFMGRGRDSRRVDPILQNIPSPPAPGESPFVPQGDTPAREDYISRTNDWLNEDVVLSLNNLQKFFEHRASHAKLREARSNDRNDTEQVRDALINADELLDAFDAGSQADLKEIYEDWQREFNDPNLPSPEGYISNLGLTISRQDDVDGISRTVLYAADVDGNPVVYIEDSDKGIAHLLDTKGRHVLSMFTDDNGEVRFMAGSAAAEKIARRGMRKPIRERIRERILRSQSGDSPAEPMSLRARRIAVERSKTRSGLSFGKTTSGDIYIEGTGDVVAQDNAIIAANVQAQLARYDESFRRRLNISDPDAPLAEDAILSYIDELAKTDSRQAGIMKTRLHDFLVMSEIEETGDYKLINNLKPSARERVLTGVSPQTRAPRKGRYPFTPYRASTARPINIEDITAPVVVNAPINTSAPIAVPTSGVPLTPGIGNPSLGIAFDGQSGLYIDTATGLFVEDLSGLPIDRTQVYDAIDRPDMDAGDYPVVRISPPGILPPRYVRLAPGTDPDGAGKAGANNVVGVAANHNDAIEMFAVSDTASIKPGSPQAVVNKILGRNRHSILQNQTTLVDARNRMSAANVDPSVPNPDVHPVKNFTLGELLSLGQAASSDSDILTTPKAQQWIEVSDGDLTKTIESDGRLRTVFEGIGIDIDMPIGQFYIPSGAETSSEVRDSIASLNRALQAEHGREISHRLFNITESPQDSEVVDLWNKAADDLSAALKVAQNEKSAALDALPLNRRNKQEQVRLLKSGHQEELLQSLLEKHIVSNPIAMQAIELKKRNSLESSAARRNARIRAAQARASRGIRASGAFDDQPDILDPWGSATPPASPRTLDDILGVHVQHRAEGLFEDPSTSGIVQISDEQIDALSSMGELYDMQRAGSLVGLPGTPYDGVVFSDATKAMLAHMWHFNGYNSLPVLATKEEMLAASEGLITPEGTQPVFFIARGVQGSPAQQVQFVTDMLAGDRFVPGQGGQVAGLGDYWSLNPSGWSSYHGGHGGTAIAILSPQMNIVSRDAHLELFGTQNGSPLYESLWSIYNAIGAPQAPNGVNPSHGPESRFGIAPSSILPDPKTGLFSPAQIDELNGHVARLTAEGAPGRKLRNNPVWSDTSGWGEATIERSLTTGSHSGPLKRALALDIVGNTPEETAKAQEAIERRKEINAWYSQHLSWFVQLAQMRKDESLPGQAGIENKAHNEKLNRAMRSLLYMHPDVRAVMMGVDAYAADSVGMDTVLRSSLWQSIQQGNGDRIVVLNRSAMIMHREPVRTYQDWANDLMARRPQVPGVGSPIDGRRWT